MENIILANEALRLEISPRGAEMQSLVLLANGREQLWHGDPAIWGDRAPWLFPLIGQLRGGQYRYQGMPYTMPMHGFASKAVFSVKEQTPASVLFRLEASEETLAMFPWRFALEIGYRLDGGSVKVECTVRSMDEQEMYFSFGAHPGFLCAAGDELCFENATSLVCQRLCLETHLLRPESVTIEPVIELQEALFDDDAMLLRQPNSESAVLKRKDGSGVRFAFGQVPWVGVWSRKRKGLPYVCVEPWFGVDDPVDAQGDIESKLDIVHLEPHQTFAMHLEITPFC